MLSKVIKKQENKRKKQQSKLGNGKCNRPNEVVQSADMKSKKKKKNWNFSMKTDKIKYVSTIKCTYFSLRGEK